LFSNFFKNPQLIFYNIIWIDAQEENRSTDAIRSMRLFIHEEKKDIIAQKIIIGKGQLAECGDPTLYKNKIFTWN